MITDTNNSTIIRANHGYGFFEVTKELPKQVWQELTRKALLVESGLDIFSPVEKFAYQILKESGY